MKSGENMKIEQYVMAYGCEHDKLRAVVPDGFHSLRPVLRINAEIRDDKAGYIEFNTAVEKNGVRGWLNIGHWENVMVNRADDTINFETENLKITFRKTGIRGGCPAEKDNDGCFFIGKSEILRPTETITANKVFCDCEFVWTFGDISTSGVSLGKTIPAIPTEIKTIYPKRDFTVENVVKIGCSQVLGSYMVCFER